MRTYYSTRYVLAAHDFETTRKARWVADSLTDLPIAGVELVAPEPLTESQVASVHAPEYVTAVRTGQPRALAESQGFRWDPQLFQMVLASNGGVVAAAFEALQHGVSGSLSSGLHHAGHARGAGFCTFNGLAIAAHQVVQAGARSVLVLDLDAHCGGGTASLISDEPRIRQADVSVSSFDRYTATDQSGLHMVDSASDYLPTVRRVLKDLESSGPAFDLCLYNAGMDPFGHCPTGGLHGITEAILAEREALVFGWCEARRLPIAFVLAGGYLGPNLDEAGLVRLHRLTLAAASRVNIPGGSAR